LCGVPHLVVINKLQSTEASLAVSALCSRPILRACQGRPFAFHASAPQPTAISCTHQLRLSNGWSPFKAIDGFCDSFPFGRIRSFGSWPTPALFGQLTLLHRTITGRSYRSQETKLSPHIGAHRKLPAPKPRTPKFLPHRAQFFKRFLRSFFNLADGGLVFINCGFCRTSSAAKLPRSNRPPSGNAFRLLEPRIFGR